MHSSSVIALVAKPSTREPAARPISPTVTAPKTACKVVFHPADKTGMAPELGGTPATSATAVAVAASATKAAVAAAAVAAEATIGHCGSAIGRVMTADKVGGCCNPQQGACSSTLAACAPVPRRLPAPLRCRGAAGQRDKQRKAAGGDGEEGGGTTMCPRWLGEARERTCVRRCCCATLARGSQANASENGPRNPAR
jgi:hypothetical protein